MIYHLEIMLFKTKLQIKEPLKSAIKLAFLFLLKV